MENLRWGSRKQLGPFAALLAALVLFIALVPLVQQGGLGVGFVRLGFSAVLIAGLGVASENRRFLGVTVVLMLVNLAVQWLAEYITGDATSRELLRYVFGAGYLLYLVVVLIRTLAKQREASLDTVLGGINVYLLMAIAFMYLHLMIEQLEPGSYLRGGLALSDPASRPQGSMVMTFLYFSFTTITTLGYGDIAPARPVSQILCSGEAVVGQLYVAIFIGGLVALWISKIQREASEAADD